MAAQASVTERLRLFMAGDATCAEALVSELSPKLREIASGWLRRERYQAPLRPTELIQEFWVSSLASGGWRIENRDHFYALAGRVMRNRLVDLARRRLAERRGGQTGAISLDASSIRRGPSVQDASRIIEIGILMKQLESELPLSAKVVDLHYFAGFTLREIAEETGLTFKQVRGFWDDGHQWLRRKLKPKSPLKSWFRRDRA